LVSTTNQLGAYFQVFDEALLSEDESWYGGRGRDAVFQLLLNEVVAVPADNVRPWGVQRQVTMRNVFFGGQLPAFVSRLFGVDYGPFPLPGGRATIVQGQIFTTHGRHTTFAPSYRSASDMRTDEVHTALAGGPSGRILSGLYTSDIARWLGFEYKTLNAGGEN
jgi:penicillin amidase